MKQIELNISTEEQIVNQIEQNLSSEEQTVVFIKAHSLSTMKAHYSYSCILSTYLEQALVHLFPFQFQVTLETCQYHHY